MRSKVEQRIKVISYKRRLAFLIVSAVLLVLLLAGFAFFSLASIGTGDKQSLPEILSKFTFGQVRIGQRFPDKADNTSQPPRVTTQTELTQEQKTQLRESLEKDGVLDKLPATLREEILQLLR